MSFPLRLKEWWRRVGPRDRRALLLGLVVLMPIVLWGGVVRPYMTILGESRDRAEAERSLLARERGLLANADRLPDQLETATRLFEREAEVLVQAPNAVAAEGVLTDVLQRAATRSRVLLQEIRGVETVLEDEPGALQPVRLALRAESDLHGMASFLNRLEGDPMMLRILELSVEPVADRRGSDNGPTPSQMGALSFSFIVEAHWADFGPGRMTSADVIDTRLTGIPP
jgi:type II secretory pathway component PulM